MNDLKTFAFYTEGLKQTFEWASPDLSLDKGSLNAISKAAANALKSGVANGLSDASEAVKPALNDAMAASVWAWPNVTIRKNTSDVDAPRDIIDTANLRDSMDTSVNENNELEIVYTAPYAAIVHYGGITRPYGRGGDTFNYPARPWISSLFEGSNGIDQFPFMDIIQEAIDEGFE